MKPGLARRWLDVVKPFSIASVKDGYAKMYSGRLGLDEDTKEKMQASLDLFDSEKINELAISFVEENFDEAVLENSLAFFESDLGQKYMESRTAVMKSVNALIAKHMADNTKKAFGM